MHIVQNAHKKSIIKCDADFKKSAFQEFDLLVQSSAIAAGPHEVYSGLKQRLYKSVQTRP